MIVRKQYIPKRYRNKKLVNTSASGGFIAGSSNSTFIPEHKELRGIVTITDILNEGATDIHLTKTVAESLLTTITNFNNWFEWDGAGTAIKAKFSLYSIGSVSAYGIGSAGGAAGTVEKLSDLIGENIPISPAANSRLQYNGTTGKWEAAAALDLSVYATTAYVDSKVVSMDWANITGTPTKLLGYGITDAVTASTLASHIASNLHFTEGQRTKLEGIAAGAEVNVQSDWNAASGDAQILNKPTTLSGYGITDAVQINSDNWANFRYTEFALADKDVLIDAPGLI